MNLSRDRLILELDTSNNNSVQFLFINGQT
jgi:hypothetical protein